MPRTRSQSASKPKQCTDSLLVAVKQFHSTHPGYDHQAGTDFNMILLESLVLLRSAGLDLHEPTTDNNDMLARTLKLNSLNETKDYLQRRMLSSNFDFHDSNVLLGRGTISEDASNHSTSYADMMIQQFPFHGWITETMESTQLMVNKTFPTFSVLVRFMVLSARIAQQMGDKGINEHWMRLACELMLHAGLEALANCGLLEGAVESATGLLGPSVQPGILDCFAFRRLPDEAYGIDTLRYRTSPLSDLSELDRYASVPFDNATKSEELAINEMFREKANDWDAMRRSYLSEFMLPRSNMADSGQEWSLADIMASYQRRLPRLRQKYPFAATKASLVECLENLWTINNAPSISGKPVLVQIEEGGLEGLDDKEFAKFLLRVGLSGSIDNAMKRN